MQEQINQQLPEGWKIVRLGDFVEKEKGKKPKNESLHKSDEFPLPYIDIQAFEEGIIKSWTDGLGCRLCSEDDLLMVWDGSRSGLVGKGVNGALGSTLMRISFSNIYNPYAFYFLQSKYEEINTRAKGSGTPHVDPDLLWKYEFPIAPLEQQKKIVEKIEELFSELDSGIASLKTTQEQLKIYRQSLLKHAFEGKLTEQWRKDNPDKLENPEQLLARIQQEREARYQQQLEEWKQAVKNWEANGKEGKKPKTPIKPIMLNVSNAREIDLLPEVWCWMKFGDLITVASNLVSPLDYQSLPHIAPDNIERDTGKLLPYKTVEEDGVTSPKHYFYAGQIIYSKIRPNLSKLTHVDFDGLCSADMYPLQSDYYNHEFLKYLMLTKDFVTQASTAGSRSVLPKINQTELNRLLVPLCGLHEQQEIVNLLEEKLSIIEQNEKEIEIALAKAELLRQSILKRSFSGKLLV